MCILRGGGREKERRIELIFILYAAADLSLGNRSARVIVARGAINSIFEKTAQPPIEFSLFILCRSLVFYCVIRALREKYEGKG